MPMAGLSLGLCRLCSAAGGKAGMVREEALMTAVGAPVVPEHLLQVLLPRGVSARSWGQVPCGFRNWDRRSGIAPSNDGSHRHALAREKARCVLRWVGPSICSGILR